MSDDDDSDVFFYTPLTRSKFAGENSLVNSQKSSKRCHALRNSNIKAVKKPKMSYKKKSDNANEVSKLPLSKKMISPSKRKLLCFFCNKPMTKIDLENEHMQKCQLFNLSDLEDCPYGKLCLESSEDHYWAYNHSFKNVGTFQYKDSVSVRNKTSHDSSSNNSTCILPIQKFDANCTDNEKLIENCLSGDARTPESASLLQDESHYLIKSAPQENLTEKINSWTIDYSVPSSICGCNTPIENCDEEAVNLTDNEKCQIIKTAEQALHEFNKHRSPDTVNNSCGAGDIAVSTSANTGFPKSCVHVHLHVNTGAESKPNHQTSILDYFGGKKDDNEHARSILVRKDMERNKGNHFGRKEVSMSTDSAVLFKNYNEKNQYFKCPSYKIIPDTGIAVDAFCYGYIEGITAYFLSHYHYDHYRGLSKKFGQPVYCSKITGNLVTKLLYVPSHLVRVLPMEESRVIAKAEVTLLDANHCPGSVMFVFRLLSGETVLHVGDFRAHYKMESLPVFWNVSVDYLYLDTTYCFPDYDFQPQEEIISKCVSLSLKHIQSEPKTLFVIGSYTIGKEKVFKAIADALDCQIFVKSFKLKILKCIEDEDILRRISNDKIDANVHVLSMNELTPKILKSYIQELPSFKQLIAFKPTGFEYNDHHKADLDNIKPFVNKNIFIYGAVGIAGIADRMWGVP